MTRSLARRVALAAAACLAVAVPAQAATAHHGHGSSVGHGQAGQKGWSGSGKGSGGWGHGNGGVPDHGLPRSYSLPGSRLFPEGMGYDANTGWFFVGAVGDGSVIRGDVRSADGAQVFSAAGADGRKTALGARPNHGLVYVAGGSDGTVYVYDEWHGNLVAKLPNGLPATGTLLNDVAFLPDGTAFVTDSTAPVLWRVTRWHHQLKLDRWLDFTGTAFAYGPGINADGIVATDDGSTLIVNQLSTGKLFRIDVATKAVTQIDTGGFDLTNADGMDLHHHALYVVRNQNAQVVKLHLSDDLSTATVETVTTSPAFTFPTAAVVVGHRLLVLNSQFGVFGSSTPPTLPFTVTSIERP